MRTIAVLLATALVVASVVHAAELEHPAQGEPSQRRLAVPAPHLGVASTRQ
jgi:hypothetical protein